MKIFGTDLQVYWISLKSTSFKNGHHIYGIDNFQNDRKIHQLEIIRKNSKIFFKN